MKQSLYRGLFACLSLSVLASCQDYDGGFSEEQIKKAAYDKHFEKTFGTPDPNQDWSMATLVKANVNLPGLTGSAKMNICTGDPRNSSTRLLAQIMLKDGQGSIDFDAIKGSENVFVTVEQDGEYKVFCQYNIVDNFLGIGDVQMPMTRVGVGNVTEVSSFSSTCPTTQRTGTNATAEYTYFNNILSTTQIRGIKYPKTDGYENADNVKTREDWVAATKNNGLVSWDSWNGGSLTNNSPFTDESVVSFIKVTSSDFSGLTTDDMKGSVVSNTEELISWTAWGSTMTKSFEEWKQTVISGYQDPKNYGYSNEAYPFEPNSILNNTTPNDWNSVTAFDWSNPQYKDGYEIVPAGSQISYNGTSKTLSNWQADAAANISAILDGSYNGPWTNETLKNCITMASCNRNDDGAIYNGLTDDSTWELKDLAAEILDYVHPTFQYLNNVEQVASPAINYGTFNSFFGDGNFFAESVSVWDGAKLGKYYDESTMRKMENGFSIVTTANQVIELPYVFGCTAYSNQFGYIYYKETDEANIDPITLKHYVLIEDGRPSKNIYRDSWKGTAVSGDGNNSAGDGYYTYSFTDENGNPTFTGNFVGLSGEKDNPFVCTCNEAGHTGIYSDEHKHLSTCYSPADRYAQLTAKSFYGTSYRPMFFGEDGNASTGTYKWPAGYKIVFWINTLATGDPENQDNTVRTHPENCFTPSGNLGGHFNYSLPTINKRLFHNYQGTLSHTDEELKTLGQVQCISWTIEGTTFLAFGDMSGDKDLNDMVFMVSAPNSNPENTVVTVPVKWHLNYNSQHEDNDLFANETLNQGANYTNPKKSDGTNSEPTRVGYEFIGWSTSPTATSGEKNITGTVPTNSTEAIHYYALWAPVGKSYTITWHKNYDSSVYSSDCGKDDPTNDAADIHKQQIVGENESFTKPTTDPTAPSSKRFKGWSLTPTGDVLADSWFENPTNMTATGDDDHICFYAIYEDAPTPGPDPEPITWILACEDLGGSFDYDFNDVVWSVQTSWNNDTPTTKVKVLAAGGTLGFALKYNGTQICTKGNAFAETTTDDQVVNAGGENGVDRTPVEFTLTTAIENLSSNWRYFSVVVKDHGNSHHEVQNVQSSTLNSKAPQIILLPEQWEWPTELTPINQAYTNFNTWVTDNTAATWGIWSDHKQNGKTVSRQ